MHYHTYALIYLATEHPLELSSLFQSFFDLIVFYNAVLNLMLLKLTLLHILRVFWFLPFQWFGFFYFRFDFVTLLNYEWFECSFYSMKMLKNNYNWNWKIYVGGKQQLKLFKISLAFETFNGSLDVVTQKHDAIIHIKIFQQKFKFQFFCIFII